VTDGTNRLRLAAVIVGFTAAIHISAGIGHARESLVFAVVFMLAAALQAVWSVVVWRRGSRRVLLFGLLLNLGIAIVWALSRTTGLPVGPGAFTPETVGLADAQSTANELLACALIASCLLEPLRRWRPVVHCSEALALAAACVSFLLLASGASHTA
jgi:hypothetical protein